MISQPTTIAFHNDKVDFAAPALSESEQRQRVLELTVQLLIARTSMGDCWSEGLAEAGKLLAALPLATAEFAYAKRHLQNAVLYCHEKEFGAATFELRALRGQLHRL